MSLQQLNKFFRELRINIQKKHLQIIYNVSITNDFLTLLKKLQETNFIGGYKADYILNTITISLLYDHDAQSLIKDIYVISKPSYRRNLSFEKAKSFLSSYNCRLCIIRTNKGIKTLQECIRENCTGELLVIIK